MSANDSDQGGAGRREVAWRVFAAEYDDSTLDYSESDEERAPNYVITPTGARINRLFVVGVLTEVEQVSDDVLRARVVDPTGAFVLYAGQYQPDEMAFLESADPPAFVAVTGKARTFQPDDSDRIFTSIRPESINRVDADVRDRWVVQTAEQTLSRVSTFAEALDSGERGDDLREALAESGADDGLAAGIPLAIDHYGTTKAYLAEIWDLALDSARVVAGEIDADDVGPVELAPDEGGDDVTVEFDYSLTDEQAPDLGALEAEAETADAEAPTPDSTGATDAGAEAADDLGDAPTSSVADSDAEPAEAEGDTEPAETEPADAEADIDEAAAEAEARAEAESEDAPEVEDAEDAADLQAEIGDDEPPTVDAEQDTSTEESFEPETDADEELGTGGAGDEMYEFDEDERERIEEEHGLEFSSGSEVGEPGEADIETPDPEEGPDESTPERESELADEDLEPDAAAEPTAEEVDTDELQEAEPATGGTEDVVDADEDAPEGGETAAAEAPGASIAEDEIPESEDEASESEDEASEPEADEETAEDEAKETPEDLEDTVMETMRDLDAGDGVDRETLLAAVVQEYDVTPADVEDALEAALMAGRCYESGEDTLKPI